MSSEVETSLNINSKRFLDFARNDNKDQTDFMSNSPNHNCATVAAAVSAASSIATGDMPATTNPIRHLYVHIPFCARICPYCAFYKDLLDRSQTSRFCEAILREVMSARCADRTPQRGVPTILPSTIYF